MIRKNSIIKITLFVAVLSVAMFLAWELVYLSKVNSAVSHVVLIEIDQSSIDALGEYPFRRKMYANLIDKLSKNEVNTILFSIIFSSFRSDSKDDLKLRNSIETSRRVILPIWPNDTSIKFLRNRGAIFGVDGLKTNDSGIVVSMSPSIMESELPTTSALAACRFLFDADCQFSSKEINLQKPQDKFFRIPLSLALNMQDHKLKKLVKDKIAIVAVTAVGFGPSHQTRWSNNVSDSEILGVAVSNMIASIDSIVINE